MAGPSRVQNATRGHQENCAQRAHALQLPSSSLDLRDTSMKGLIRAIKSHTQQNIQIW